MSSIISEADFSAIKKSAHKNRTDNTLFSKLVRKAKIVRHITLPGNTIRLNSIVTLWHSVLNKVISFRIVLPHKADIHSRAISVFAPMSMAIFGLKEQESVSINSGTIEKQLRIIKVIND